MKFLGSILLFLSIISRGASLCNSELERAHSQLLLELTLFQEGSAKGAVKPLESLRFDGLSEAEIQKLHKIFKPFREKGTLSRLQLERTMAALLKLTRPELRYRDWGDAKIWASLEASIAKRGILETFKQAGILADSNLLEAYLLFTKDHEQILQPLMSLTGNLYFSSRGGVALGWPKYDFVKWQKLPPPLLTAIARDGIPAHRAELEAIWGEKVRTQAAWNHIEAAFNTAIGVVIANLAYQQLQRQLGEDEDKKKPESKN